MASIKKVWVSWNARESRWQVRHYWEGKLKTYQSWTVNGQKYAFTQENRQWADSLADFIRAKMMPNIDGIVTFHPSQIRTGKNDSFYSFRKYADLWVQGYHQQAFTGDRSQEYAQHLERYCRRYLTPRLGNLDIREINTAIVKDFYLWLHTDFDLSKKYIQNIMDAFRKLISEALEDTNLKPPKFPDYKVKKSSKKAPPEWLTEEEQDLVVSQVLPRHRPIIMAIFYHGLRHIEAREQKRSDYKDGYLTVRTAKGGVDRVIRLEPDVVKAMMSVPPAITDHLFHNEGKPYAKTTLWKIERKALDDAGFSGVTPNQAGRHSFGSQRIRRGQPTRSLQYEMGHADIRTTEIYTHVRPEDQKKWRRG